MPHRIVSTKRYLCITRRRFLVQIVGSMEMWEAGWYTSRLEIRDTFTCGEGAWQGPREPNSRFRAETSIPLDREQKSAVVGESRTHATDTGSVEVQVSLLTRRIAELSEHFKVHRHDHAGRRGLIQMVGERRRLLQYLSREDVGRYRTLVARLGLRK